MSKDKNNEIDDDFNFDDLDGIGNDLDSDFDLDDDGMGDERGPSNLALAGELAAEAGTGFMEGLIEKASKDALPSSFSENYAEVGEYKDLFVDEFQKSKSKLGKAVSGLAKETKKFLPFRIGIVDKMLDSVIGDDDETYRAESEESMRNSQIESNLNSIFNKQLEFTAQLEAKRDAKEDADDRREMIQDKRESSFLASIANNTGWVKSYSEQVGIEFSRKTLEIQMKSFFVQTDLLKTSKDSFKAFSLQFDSIVKNTGLPDYVKLQTKERLGDVIRTNVSRGIYQKAFENNAYVTRVKRRFGDYVGEKVDDLTDKMSDVTDVLTNLNDAGDSDTNIVSKLVAGMSGSLLGEKAGKKAAEWIKPKLKDNELINETGNLLETLGTSPSTLFSYLRRKNQVWLDDLETRDNMSGSFLAKVSSILNDISGVTTNDVVGKDIEQKINFEDHENVAKFDNKVHRSITEAIPMLLSRILRETTDHKNAFMKVNQGKVKNTGGFTTSEEQVYNYVDRELSTKDKFISSLEKDVVRSDGKRKLKYAAERLHHELGNIDKSKAKKHLRSEDNKKLMVSYVMKASRLLDGKINLENLVLNPDEKLQKTIEEDPKLKRLLTGLKEVYEAAAHDQQVKVADSQKRSLEDATSRYPLNTVIEVVREASRLASNFMPRADLNLLTRDEALYLARAFSNYTINSNQDLVPYEIVNGKAFTYLETKALELPGFKEKIELFALDCRLILESANFLIETKLVTYFGAMNTALKNNIEATSVLESINRYSPQLFKGKVSVDNLVEGKLTKYEASLYLDREESRELTRMRPGAAKELIRSGSETNLEGMVDRVLDKASSSYDKAKAKTTDYINYVKDLKSSLKGKNAEEVAKILAGEASKVSDKIGQMSKKAYEKLGTGFGKLANLAHDIANKNIDAVVENLSERAKELREAIAAEEDNLRRTIATLEAMRTEVGNSINVDRERLEENIETRIRRETRVSETKTKALTQMLTKIERMIERLRKAGEMNLETLKSEFDGLINTMKNYREKFTQAYDEAGTPAAPVATPPATPPSTPVPPPPAPAA